MPEDLRDEEDDETLADARPEERRTIAAVLNRVGDDRDEERCAAAEAGRDDARREAAAILEPLQRRADGTRCRPAAAPMPATRVQAYRALAASSRTPCPPTPAAQHRPPR